MNDFERRIRQMINPYSTRFTQWWCNSSIRAALRRRPADTVSDLRDSDAAKRAATALKDLRDSEAAKRAASAFSDLRDSDAAKRAAGALADLRQRESVRKAEESAKRALHDLRSGHGAGDSAS